MKVRQINMRCDWLVGPHAVQLRGEGGRLAGVKKSRSHQSFRFLLLTFHGGRRRSGLRGGFNLEAFLKEDVSGKEGHYNQRPSNPTAR